MDESPLQTGEAQPAAVTQAAPLISGAPQLLWSGFAAFVIIFLVVFFLLTRWRAAQRARDEAPTEFFQPAGEDAEISFDERDRHANPSPVIEAPAGEGIFADAPPRKKRGPFAGLFARRERIQPEAQEAEVIDLGADDEGLASVRIERPYKSVFGEDNRETPVAANWASIEQEQQRRAEDENSRRRDEDAASEMRRREEEGAAANRQRRLEDDNRRRLAEDDRRRGEREAATRIQEIEKSRAAQPTARVAEPDRLGAHDDIVRTLSEVEEALHAQREAIQAETRSLLDSFARRFSDRLDALASSVEKKSSQRSDGGAADRAGESPALADLIARRLDEYQREVVQSLTSLGKRIDAVGSAPGDSAVLREEMAKLRSALGGRTPSAPAVQLADVVRNALAPSAYEFNAILPGNRRTDCLIKLARPPGPIAIDARFPVEAFHALGEGRSDAETEFRRTALRHVVDVAERLIVPGVTADSALMFIPSETMVAELHARFPDVVQDSWRARVWIVSPTSLMATLHTISGLMRDAAARAAGVVHNDAQRALAEVERLSERIAALESHSRPATSTPAAAAQADWRLESRFDEDVERGPKRALQPADNGHGGSGGDLYADEHAADEDAAEPERSRPPFPLR